MLSKVLYAYSEYSADCSVKYYTHTVNTAKTAQQRRNGMHERNSGNLKGATYVTGTAISTERQKNRLALQKPIYKKEARVRF